MKIHKFNESNSLGKKVAFLFDFFNDLKDENFRVEVVDKQNTDFNGWIGITIWICDLSLIGAGKRISQDRIDEILKILKRLEFFEIFTKNFTTVLNYVRIDFDVDDIPES